MSFSRHRGIYCVAFRIGRTEVLVVKLPSGHAMSSRRLFLSGLLSSRARLRFAGYIMLPTQNAAGPALPRTQRLCLSARSWQERISDGIINPNLG
jgi:hypothetical protein